MKITLSQYLRRKRFDLTERRILSSKNKNLIKSWLIFKMALEQHGF